MSWMSGLYNRIHGSSRFLTYLPQPITDFLSSPPYYSTFLNLHCIFIHPWLSCSLVSLSPDDFSNSITCMPFENLLMFQNSDLMSSKSIFIPTHVTDQPCLLLCNQLASKITLHQALSWIGIYLCLFLQVIKSRAVETFPYFCFCLPS